MAETINKGTMDLSTLQQTISDLIPSAVFNPNSQFLEFVIPPNEIHSVSLLLKNNQDTRFDFLFCQSGVDIKGELGVVYHLRSTTLGHSLVMKIFTGNRENAAFDTVSDIWPTAEFLEREIFDLLGIRFNNHPDMRRLFLEEDFTGFPLRKDFADPINMIEP